VFHQRKFTQICFGVLLFLVEEENSLIKKMHDEEATMVSKCANPECSESFLYFHQGKLFRLETEGREDRRRQLGDETGISKPLRRLEFYWLCGGCAETLTIAFEKGSGISVRPRPVRPQAARVSARANATAA